MMIDKLSRYNQGTDRYGYLYYDRRKHSELLQITVGLITSFISKFSEEKIVN
jgi:hypothetical protein